MRDNTTPMYRPADIAARCQVSTRTVMRAIRSGRLRASRLGSRGAYRVRPEDLEAWIVGTTVLPLPQPGCPPERAVPGRLIVTEEMGRHGHRAPPATP
jgi:excisionase family DNA binding protein